MAAATKRKRYFADPDYRALNDHPRLPTEWEQMEGVAGISAKALSAYRKREEAVVRMVEAAGDALEWPVGEEDAILTLTEVARQSGTIADHQELQILPDDPIGDEIERLRLAGNTVAKIMEALSAAARDAGLIEDGEYLSITPKGR